MEEKPQKLPSLLEMAFNLTESMAETLNQLLETGAVLAEADVAKERMETCLECPQFIKELENGIIPARCAVCGCGLKLKTRLVPNQCPLNKWKR